MELGFFTYLPVAINDVIELVALQIMANAGDGLQVSPAHIVSQIPNVTNPDASITLDMILRVLASHSLLSCSVSTYKNGKPKRLYGLTPLYKYLVQNKDGLSLAQLALMNQDKVFIDTWHYLKDAILEGSQPFTKVHGVNTFDYLAKEHTEEEFKDPSKAIVFAGGVKPICCVNGVWVIEFQK
ncbi:caffeic acid 3-O-methyltransferase-like [Cryptomeria japonica]|uniref:caffeic acid 3-O-methyltransferase-like n=1 Tax=Cryptomeria japonica TaxID=3369 RepID=UPI0027D9DABD|nr:caffeic acid 3-O-methyltransferase-like [Cryptomeria japonica]